jgi:hypothetical protein
MRILPQVWLELGGIKDLGAVFTDAARFPSGEDCPIFDWLQHAPSAIEQAEKMLAFC